MSQALPVATDCCFPQANCAITIVTGGGGGGGGGIVTGWFKVKSLSEARAIPSSATNEFVAINGTEIGGDGFIGDFTYDVNSALPDDGAGVLQPQDLPALGRWIRIT